MALKYKGLGGAMKMGLDIRSNLISTMLIMGLFLEQLKERHNLKISSIEAVRLASQKKMDELSKIVCDLHIPQDCELVICGSLARQEFTKDSDVDWTLLIDGTVDAHHIDIAKAIEKSFCDKGLKAPGKTGIFGNLAFSHDLVHLIGGDTDSNKNTTTRILLLLESCVVGKSLVRNRVVRAILERYLEEDTHFKPQTSHKIPRFLVNDIVRYWRTMAVDYASKVRSRSGNGWALRNIKLRFSRKLIFISGLIRCLECELHPPKNEENIYQSIPFINSLEEGMKQIPLETLAQTVVHYASDDGNLARALFENYDIFLSKINDEQLRKKLDDIDYEKAESDSDFQKLREVSHEFQRGLNKLFFESNSELKQLTQEFGVF